MHVCIPAYMHSMLTSRVGVYMFMCKKLPEGDNRWVYSEISKSYTNSLYHH